MKKTVYLPISVPDSNLCFGFDENDNVHICDHFDNTGGHPCCAMGIHIPIENIDEDGYTKKPMECIKLINPKQLEQFKNVMKNVVMKNEFKPDYVSPPVDTILEFLDENNISIYDFLSRTIITPEEWRDIIDGKAGAITEDIALSISCVTGTQEFWVNRQRNYDNYLKTMGVTHTPI